MRAAIIEDERSNATRLARLLEKLAPGTDIVVYLESVEDAQNWFLNNEMPDIVFMDVQLSDGVCFEIFEAVSIDAPIIFTTAYDEYALHAFKVNSVDYLLKPIDPENLARALEKYDKYFAGLPKQKENLEALIASITQVKTGYRNRLLVKHRSSFVSLQVEEIAFIAVNAQLVYVHTMDAAKYMVDSHLDELEKTLDPKKFFRINRQTIINISAIGRILDYPGSRLKLLPLPDYDGEMIVSRDRVSAFKEWLNS